MRSCSAIWASRPVVAPSSGGPVEALGRHPLPHCTRQTPCRNGWPGSAQVGCSGQSRTRLVLRPFTLYFCCRWAPSSTMSAAFVTRVRSCALRHGPTPGPSATTGGQHACDAAAPPPSPSIGRRSGTSSSTPSCRFLFVPGPLFGLPPALPLPAAHRSRTPSHWQTAAAPTRSCWMSARSSAHADRQTDSGQQVPGVAAWPATRPCGNAGRLQRNIPPGPHRCQPAGPGRQRLPNASLALWCVVHFQGAGGRGRVRIRFGQRLAQHLLQHLAVSRPGRSSTGCLPEFWPMTADSVPAWQPRHTQHGGGLAQALRARWARGGGTDAAEASLALGAATPGTPRLGAGPHSFASGRPDAPGSAGRGCGSARGGAAARCAQRPEFTVTGPGQKASIGRCSRGRHLPRRNARWHHLGRTLAGRSTDDRWAVPLAAKITAAAAARGHRSAGTRPIDGLGREGRPRWPAAKTILPHRRRPATSGAQTPGGSGHGRIGRFRGRLRGNPARRWIAGRARGVRPPP